MSLNSTATNVAYNIFFDKSSHIIGQLRFVDKNNAKLLELEKENTVYFGRIINGSSWYADCNGVPKSYSCSLSDLKRFENIALTPFNLLYHQINDRTEARKTIDGGIIIRRKKGFQNLQGISEPEAAFSRADYENIKKCFNM